MGAARKLSIALTEELALEIEAAVATGDYSTASEVVRNALRLWKTKRAEQTAALERLRGLWREGVESGDPTPIRDSWADDLIAAGRTLGVKRKAG